MEETLVKLLHLNLQKIPQIVQTLELKKNEATNWSRQDTPKT